MAANETENTNPSGTRHLANLGELFRWQRVNWLGDFLETYDEHIKGLYTRMKRQLATAYPEAQEALQQLETKAGETVVNHVVTSARVTNVLKNLHSKNLQKAASVVIRSIASEAARSQGGQAGESYWGVDGDFALLFKNDQHNMINFESISGGITLDFFSPSNSSISTISGIECGKLDYAEATQVTETIQRVVAPVTDTPPYAMVKQLIRSLVIKKPQSVSLGELVSCTYADLPRQINLLVSPEQKLYDGEYIDALIHECIHTLLTMIDDLEPWMPDPVTYPQVMERVKSPWTGNMALTQAMLHAVYVWYALYNFWLNDDWAEAYDQGYRLERMRMIKTGFERFDPHELFPVQLSLHPAVYHSYQEMKAHIVQHQTVNS